MKQAAERLKMAAMGDTLGGAIARLGALRRRCVLLASGGME